MTSTSLSGGGGGAPQVIGGATVGEAGEAGTIYEGYTLSWGDDFNTLDIVAPHRPRGKFVTTRTYLPGARGSDTLLSRQYDTDPFHTGHNDINRGVPVASYDNMRIESGGILHLGARFAPVSERATFQGTTRKLATAMVSSAMACGFYPSLEGTGDVIFEARIRHSAGNPETNHPTLWSQSLTPVTVANGQTADEWDFEGEGNSVNLRRNQWFTGEMSSSVPPNFTMDDQYYTWTFILNETQARLYKDGVLFSSIAVDANVSNKMAYMLLTSHVVSGDDLDIPNWEADADGAYMKVDYCRIWRRSGRQHFKPLVSASDVNIDFGGSTSIVLPSKLAIWGDDTVTEYLQAVPIEENEPGGAHATHYNVFPTGVSYNAGTRTLTVAPTSPLAGRLHFVLYGYLPDGSTGEPYRFAVNVGPVINAGGIEYTVGTPLSFDLYPLCDCGVLVTDGVSRTKTISVTGLPGWASYSDATGLLTGTPTDTGTTAITITVTNSIGQSASRVINLSKAVPAVTSFSDNFTGTTGQALEGRTGWTLLSGTAASALLSATNSLRANNANAIGAAYLSPDLGSANHYVEAKFLAATTGPGLCLRMTDVNNLLMLRRNAGNLEFLTRVGGTLTIVGTYTPPGLSLTDVIRFEVNGSSVAVRQNGTLLTVTGSQSVGAVPSSTRQGLVVRSAAVNPWIDDYAAGLV
jgi:hypothetical protein